MIKIKINQCRSNPDKRSISILGDNIDLVLFTDKIKIELDKELPNPLDLDSPVSVWQDAK